MMVLRQDCGAGDFGPCSFGVCFGVLACACVLRSSFTGDHLSGGGECKGTPAVSGVKGLGRRFSALSIAAIRSMRAQSRAHAR